MLSRETIIREARLSQHDLHRIAPLRLPHTRFGFAYQVAFVKLFGRLPKQEPFELQEELAAFVAGQLGLEGKELELLDRYRRRQPTVSAHAEQIRQHLGYRPLGATDEPPLREYIREQALHLDQSVGLLALAEAFLRSRNILLPAASTLERIVGHERASVQSLLAGRIYGDVSPEERRLLLRFLQTDERGLSPLQQIREPPKNASPAAVLFELDKLTLIESSQVLGKDITWVRTTMRKAMAQRIRYSSVHRIRELEEQRRIACMVCFMHEAYSETIDHVVDLHGKIMTQTFRRAKNQLDVEYQEHRRSLIMRLNSFQMIGDVLLDDAVPDNQVREEVLRRIPAEELARQIRETREWLQQRQSTLEKVSDRFAYLRRFSPQLLRRLDFAAQGSPSPGTKGLIESINLLRDLNESRRRKLPDDPPTSFLPKKTQALLNRDRQVDRAAYECAVLTALRDEIRRGNLTVGGSAKFGPFENFLMPRPVWLEQRDTFFSRAALPTNGSEVADYLSVKLEGAFDQFLSGFGDNDFVRVDDTSGWRFGSDTAIAMSDDDAQNLRRLKSHLASGMRTIRLPDLLIEVDNAVDFSGTLLHRGPHDPAGVCQTLAAIMAYGCNLGPDTMAKLTHGVTYSQIKKIADWHFHEESLRPALARIVNAITNMEASENWGTAKTSSSDGQRFRYPRRSAMRTYSHRMTDYAVEFYSFIADNYAPFYSTPIECTDRDAAYVLDGLLYHEADLDIDEHYVDTHGYTEANFAAFAMMGKRFSPRIRGLHRQRIYRADSDRDYGALESMLKPRDRQLHLNWVEDHWDDMGRFFCSMASGYSTASIAMKRLVGFGPANHLNRAVRELGRAYKTMYILGYVSEPTLRRRVRRGLLKSEELHALARSVFYGKLGKADWRDFRRQMSTASCLLIILAAIVFWQIREIERVMKDAPDDIDPGLLRHISPITWENVILYGAYRLRPELVRPRST